MVPTSQVPGLGADDNFLGSLFRIAFSNRLFESIFRSSFSDRLFGPLLRIVFSDRLFGSIFRSPPLSGPAPRTPTSPPAGGGDQSLLPHMWWRGSPELPPHEAWSVPPPPPAAPSLPPPTGPKRVLNLPRWAYYLQKIQTVGCGRDYGSLGRYGRMERGWRGGGAGGLGVMEKTGPSRLGVVRVFHAHAHRRRGTQRLIYGSQRRSLMDYGPAPCVQPT